MSRLQELVAAEPIDVGAIATYLESLTGPQRVEAIRSLGGVELQARLYAACANARPVLASDLVPATVSDLQPVIHYGKNSLPAFTFFEKRFCRPGGGAELWGYNEQSNAWITGPGYFIAHGEDGSGVVIDYRRVPPKGAAGWPAVLPNDRGFSRLVYMNMVDVLRRVSDHVLIGRATRGGKDQDNYFLLCREEPASPLVSSAPVSDERNIRDVGGTPGGLGEFLVGLVMACAGGYLITQQVTVTAGFWSFYGGSAFGITLIPMLFGVGLLFFNGKNVLGWLLTVAGSVFILAGIIANMHIYFQSTSLFNTLVMLVLLVGGLGLIARSLRAHGAPPPQK